MATVPGLAPRILSRLLDRAADGVADRLAERLSTVPPRAPVIAAEPADRESTDNRNLELLLGFTLRPDSNCLEIGANEGRFLHSMMRHAPHGRHIAWEPLPQMAAALRAAFPAVEVREAALADVSGQTEFVVVPAELGYSGMRERAYPDPNWETERIAVQVERVDDVVAADHRVDFMKVDVEGAELQVFRGALETLKRNRPVIAFEHGPGAADRYGTRPEDIWDLVVDEVGLRIYDMDAQGPLARARFAELFASGTRWNYVARL